MIVMNIRTATIANRLALIFGTYLLTLAVTCTTSQAYSDYSGCSGCHGAFNGNSSPKGTVFPGNSNHNMHTNSASMATACTLCHMTPGSVPVYTYQSGGTTHNTGLGCSGCHVGPGLRKHHDANGVTECYDCHDPSETSDPENVKPPYYGTVDTRVDNPGNPVPVANTNENWSVGDFLGLDNDGNNLYDARDPAITPYRIAGAAKEGNNIRITWVTAGGRIDTVMVATNVAGPYSNLSTTISIPGVGQVTTNYLHVNAATNSLRFYRLNCTP